ncbi:MAG TPA: endonuclease III [Syntrophales bacterium]|jgi:endonuclease-3|nr:endonuclease III [Syntrophales bacterium]HOX94151.1 endonuclease III [Syntrophales bacterium]HPN25409.1 endonuclease III [Syntrophales bacterium]HQM29891.1 endonuclease III [Syntrophales bacterium]
MNDRDIVHVIRILKAELKKWELPITTALAERKSDPFKILISTVLSSRTKDEVTAAATERLFKLASSPEKMLKLSEETVARAIYPVGFYRSKSRHVREVCRALTERFHSIVPDRLEDLLTLKGVGRKTANLVLALAHQKDGLCVDTHVHRISNRLGYVATKSPKETEFALREKLPRRYWAVFNTLLVAHGQNICRPLSPFCSRCPIYDYCDRRGVTRSR